MRCALVVFPGSNCDRDCEHVLTYVLGAQVLRVWHTHTQLPAQVDCVILPGGFSHGDHLRAGAIASTSPIMRSVREFAARGGKVLGICNGFQILLEAGMLPGALLTNASGRFVCRQTRVLCARSHTPFTAGLEGQILTLPIAHAQGNYFIDAAGLKTLQREGQVVMHYTSECSELSDESNPNGSLMGIAAVCNARGNVMGMMPHPERACEVILGSEDGQAILRNALTASVQAQQGDERE